MTDNAQEIDEILTIFLHDCSDYEQGKPVNLDMSFTQTKKRVLDWHNKQIAKARLVEWEQFGEFLCDADKRSLCKNFLDLYRIHGDRLSATLKEHKD